MLTKLKQKIAAILIKLGLMKTPTIEDVKPQPVEPISVPQSGEITDAMVVNTIIACATQYEKVREDKGPNRSTLIDQWNKKLGVALGSPYCITGIQVALDEVQTKLNIRFTRLYTASTQELYNWMVKNHPDCLFQTPEVGDTGIYQTRADSSRGHAVLVTKKIYDSTGKIYGTFEFNTDVEGNRDGQGCMFRTRSLDGDSRLKLRGFIRWTKLYKKLGAATPGTVVTAPVSSDASDSVFDMDAWTFASLNISQQFEGSTPWANPTGDFDGMGLTCGALGWTFGYGDHQRLVKLYISRHGEAKLKALMPKVGAEYIKAVNMVLKEGRDLVSAWGNKKTGAVYEPYRSELVAFWTTKEMKAIQLEEATKNMGAFAKQQMEIAMPLLGLTKPAFWLFEYFFDLRVLNGSMKITVQQAIDNCGNTPDDDLKKALADVQSWTGMTIKDAKYNATQILAKLSSLPHANKVMIFHGWMRAKQSRADFIPVTFNRRAMLAAKAGRVNGTDYKLEGLILKKA